MQWKTSASPLFQSCRKSIVIFDIFFLLKLVFPILRGAHHTVYNELRVDVLFTQFACAQQFW